MNIAESAANELVGNIVLFFSSVLERFRFRKSDSAAFYLVAGISVKKKNWPSLSLALPM